jgi:hypothetical protein
MHARTRRWVGGREGGRAGEGALRMYQRVAGWVGACERGGGALSRSRKDKLYQAKYNILMSEP